jgi:hypothetical protein
LEIKRKKNTVLDAVPDGGEKQLLIYSSGIYPKGLQKKTSKFT